MSRRSTSRRHIINVSSGSNSPKVNWQGKSNRNLQNKYSFNYIMKVRFILFLVVGFSTREDALNQTNVLTKNGNFVKALREIDSPDNPNSTNLREKLNKTESNTG